MYRPTKVAKYAPRYDGVLQTRLQRYPDDYLKVSSDPLPFYRSLLNPMGTHVGGRVPDLAVYPSAVATLDLELTQPVQSGATCGGLLILTSNGIRYYAETAMNAGTVTWISENTTGNDTYSGNATNGNTTLNGVASLQGLADAYRIVGAGLNVEFIGNDANNQGQIICMQKTAQAISHDQVHWYQTEAQMSNQKQNYTGAAKNGAYIAWKPADTDDLNYGTAQATATLQNTRVWYSDLVTALRRDTRNYGNLQWHASGLGTDCSFRVTVRVHIEMLQSAEVFSTRADEGVTVNPSAVSDAFAAAAVKNIPGAAKSTATFGALNKFVTDLAVRSADTMAARIIESGGKHVLNAIGKNFLG